MKSNRLESLCRLLVLTIVFLMMGCDKKASPPAPVNDGPSKTSDKSAHPDTSTTETKNETPINDVQNVDNTRNQSSPSANDSNSLEDETPVEIATIEKATPPDPPVPVTGPMTMADGQVLNVRQKERDGIVIEQWCEKTKPGGVVVKEGPFSRWHPHGGPYLKGAFKDGAQHGPLYSWYPNGQIRGIGQMNHGLKMGRWMKWDDTGTLRNEMTYRNDMKHGFWKEYDANGGPVTWGEHVDDRKHGIWYTTESDGSVSEEKWNNGTVVQD